MIEALQNQKKTKNRKAMMFFQKIKMIQAVKSYVSTHDATVKKD